MTSEQRGRIEVDGAGSVSVIKIAPSAPSRGVIFAYAPGAGSNINDPFGAYCGRELARAGIETWRFQFPYAEAKRPAPDRPPVLMATWRAVLDAALKASPCVVIGGRSMGGRIASMVASEGAPASALALFAYPLHPPGRPEQRRDEHLPGIAAPTLFCSGTRDTYATPEELTGAAALVPTASVHLLDGADHGFNVLKASGRGREDVWAEAVQALLRFLEPLA